MNYSERNGSSSMMGTGYLGETRTGPDGNLYQWVEGIDGLGNPIGFWSKLRNIGQKAFHAAKKVARYHPGVQALKLVSRGVSGYEGLGALYQAPDGSMYQMQGLAEDEMQGLSADEVTQMMGTGYLGETRMGPDGNLYQWVEGVDGLGNLTGIWSKLKKFGKKVQGFVKTAMPFAKKIAPFIPGGAAVLTAATPILKQAGVAGYDGLGALYQAPDGTLYQMQGLAEDEDLREFAEDEDLRGYGENEALYGYGEDEDLRGFAEDEDLRGYGEEDDLRGIEGYIRQDGMSGLEGYEHQRLPITPLFTGRCPQAPDSCWPKPW